MSLTFRQLQLEMRADARRNPPHVMVVESYGRYACSALAQGLQLIDIKLRNDPPASGVGQELARPQFDRSAFCGPNPKNHDFIFALMALEGIDRRRLDAVGEEQDGTWRLLVGKALFYCL